jgi:hypothetical protein
LKLNGHRCAAKVCEARKSTLPYFFKNCFGAKGIVALNGRVVMTLPDLDFRVDHERWAVEVTHVDQQLLVAGKGLPRPVQSRQN